MHQKIAQSRCLICLHIEGEQGHDNEGWGRVGAVRQCTSVKMGTVMPTRWGYGVNLHIHVTHNTVLLVLANSSSTRRHCTVTTHSVYFHNSTSSKPTKSNNLTAAIQPPN
jgi:hypothetical protein